MSTFAWKTIALAALVVIGVRPDEAKEAITIEGRVSREYEEDQRLQ